MVEASAEKIRNLRERLDGAAEVVASVLNRREEWLRMYRATNTTEIQACETVWWRVYEEALHAARSVENRIATDLRAEHDLLKLAQDKAAQESQT